MKAPLFVFGLALLATACSRSLPLSRPSAIARAATAAAADTSANPDFKLNVHYPMKQYVTAHSNTDSFYILYSPRQLGPPLQQEIGFAFRCSRPVIVVDLAIDLPNPGYTHTVTIWDSTTEQVVAQGRVTTTNPGWNYGSSMGIGADTTLLPDHGYIIGFNTRAIGTPINTTNDGDQLWMCWGIYEQFTTDEQEIPLFPFTQGSVTYEGEYIDYYSYDNGPPYYPGLTGLQSNGTTFVGFCDFGSLF